jgi:hypothetical protein
MMAGADVIKTSTGKEGVNATFPVAIAMVRALREYYERTGFKVVFSFLFFSFLSFSSRSRQQSNTRPCLIKYTRLASSPPAASSRPRMPSRGLPS